MAKYEKTERLEKVPMEYLWEGLVLSDNLTIIMEAYF